MFYFYFFLATIVQYCFGRRLSTLHLCSLSLCKNNTFSEVIGPLHRKWRWSLFPLFMVIHDFFLFLYKMLKFEKIYTGRGTITITLTIVVETKVIKRWPSYFVRAPDCSWFSRVNVLLLNFRLPVVQGTLSLLQNGIPIEVNSLT